MQRASRAAENGAVPIKMQFVKIVIVLLALCGVAAAQYQDRDTRGLPKTSSSAPPEELRTDVNHATLGELLKVPGMTPSWAGRIVHYRPYHTKADLLDRGIVTAAVYDRIKDYVIAHRDKQ